MTRPAPGPNHARPPAGAENVTWTIRAEKWPLLVAVVSQADAWTDGPQNDGTAATASERGAAQGSRRPACLPSRPAAAASAAAPRFRLRNTHDVLNTPDQPPCPAVCDYRRISQAARRGTLCFNWQCRGALRNRPDPWTNT